MKNKIILTITISFAVLISTGQDLKKVKQLFQTAEQHLLYEEYDIALPIYLDLIAEGWDNANVQFSIGMCYLKMSGPPSLAIPYLEKAAENTTANFREGNYKEDKAPEEVFFYLAKAYRLTNQYPKAIEMYKKYKATLAVNDLYYHDFVDLQIRTCETAQQMMASPIYAIQTVVDFGEEGDNYYPAISGDENSIAFTALQNVRDEYTGEQIPFNIVYYTIKEAGIWKKPKDITYDIVSDGYFSTSYMSYNGDYMILYRDDYGNGNLYFTKLEGRKWEPIEKFPKQISSRDNETHASLSKDGSTMYMVSDRPGGYGGRDIYKVIKDNKGRWGAPINIGDVINTPFEEETPFLTEDGKTLYFASEAHSSMGGFDIFKSTLDDAGNWSQPVNLGYPVNTPDDDKFFVPIADGSIAYMYKVPEGGSDERIMRVEFPKIEQIVQVMPEPTSFDDTLNVADNYQQNTATETTTESPYQTETVQNNQAQTPALGDNNQTQQIQTIVLPIDYQIIGRLTLDDNKELDNSFYVHVAKPDGEVVAALSPDNSGRFVTRLKPGQYKINAYGDGYEPASKSLFISDSEQSPEVLTFLGMKPKQVSTGEYYSIKSILFDYNSPQLNRDAQIEIEKLSALMQANPTLKAEIVGNTDALGSDEYNKSLSFKRAQSVVNYINKKGINNSRFVTKGLGATHFIAINQNPDGSDNPEGRRLNRRVDIKIINAENVNVVTENIYVPDELKYKEHLTYTILLMIAPKPLEASYFKKSGYKVNNVWMYQTSEGYLYTVGQFGQKADALDMMNKVVDAGFPDAKIISSLEYHELIQANTNVYKQKLAEESNQVFTIQLCALKNPIENNKLKGMFDVEVVHGNDGFYRYVYGEFIGKISAKQALNDVLQRGFTDAFIVEVNNLKDK